MKFVVLCVDRDDDIGKKTGIKGPIIGEKDNVETGKKLLLADPEDSDGNAVFAAVQFAKKEKDAVGVATITGDKSRGYKADKKISKQVEKVLEKFPEAEGVFLVTDGADDDQIIPVVQSITRIIGKKTVIVKQAAQLEKQYYVIKQALHDPAFARLLFGLPGVILLLVAFLQDLGIQITVLAIGVYLILKGFGIEEPLLNSVRGFKETTRIDRASFPLYIGSLLILLLGLIAGFENISSQSIFVQVAQFMQGSLSFFWVSAVLFTLGRFGDMFYLKEMSATRGYAIYLISITSLLFVLNKSATLILGYTGFYELILAVLIAFFATIIGIAAVRKIYLEKYIVPFIEKGKDVYDTKGNKVGKVSAVHKKEKFLKIKARSKTVTVPFLRVVLATPEYISVRMES